MADLLQESSQWLEDNRDEKRTITVDYDRDGDVISDVNATVGKHIFEIINGFGIIERWESRDYLILSEDLNFGSGPVVPERGDEIRETVGSIVYIYEIMAPSGEDFYMYSDPFRQTLRIHTKQVRTE